MAYHQKCPNRTTYEGGVGGGGGWGGGWGNVAIRVRPVRVLISRLQAGRVGEQQRQQGGRNYVRGDKTVQNIVDKNNA